LRIRALKKNLFRVVMIVPASFSLNTFHIVKHPVVMLNEIERVLAIDGSLMVTDIRRSWLGLFMPILKTAYTSAQSRDLLSRSKLRRYEFLQGRFWHSALQNQTGLNVNADTALCVWATGPGNRTSTLGKAEHE
jgi:ubiquinone/menaquinone biosynthesis C-methylase UbiE